MEAGRLDAPLWAKTNTNEDYRLALVVMAAGGRVLVTDRLAEQDRSGVTLTMTKTPEGLQLDARYTNPDVQARALNAVSVFIWRVFNGR